MFTKFQTLIDTILSENNSVGMVFGNTTANPDDNVVTTGDIKTSMAISGGVKPKKKKKKSFFPTAKRKFPETIVIKR
jgi:hypothetical protein